jgi:hypothetical protein
MRRPSQRVLLVVLAILNGPAVSARQADAVLTVWKVGSPHRGDIPSAAPPPDLARQALRQGLTLRVEAFPAEGFAARFFAAIKGRTAPDILAFDNFGIIDGITTPLGTFAGIRQDPAVRRDLVQVQGAFDEILRPGQGWTFLVKSSARHAAAASLALRAPGCPTLPAPSRGPADLAPIAAIVAKAQLTGDFTGVQHYVDPERVRGFSTRATAARVDTVASCGVWGNERLAFALQRAAFDVGGTIGHASLLLVFRRPATTWQLLAASRDPVSTGVFIRQVPALAGALAREPGRRALPAPPVLLSPADGMYPAPQAGHRFGDFRWRSSGSTNVVGHIAEFAYDDDARFFLTPFFSRNQGQVSAGQLWTTRGPWTWRVWAIADTGDVAFSETRTFVH